MSLKKEEKKRSVHELNQQQRAYMAINKYSDINVGDKINMGFGGMNVFSAVIY